MTYSKQQTFNKVIRHLRAQGVRSRRMGCCAYRGNHGLQCAVGCLIPNELYSPDMEGLGAGRPDVKYLLELLGHDVELCGRLQSLHDIHMDGGYTEQTDFVAQCIANMHGLKMPEEL